MEAKIPKEVKEIAKILIKHHYQAYLVGGCVRDILIGREPKDWDVATSARPEEIQNLFPDSIYENQFGTVLVKATRGTTQTGTQNDAENFPRKSASSPRESALNVVEVTTLRLEGKYTDKRHPDEIKFAKTIEEDLARRDFAINALAAEIQFGEVRPPKIDDNIGRSNLQNIKIIDPFNGQKDLENKIIRSVGNPEERFNEDALRLIRAVRFAVELNFHIEEKTAEAVKKHARLLEVIAKERIRDELEKIIMTPAAAQGIRLLEDLGLLQYIIPELSEGKGISQNKHHIYEVFDHNVRALDYATKKNYSLIIRLAALLHDVGKPRTKQGEGPDSTFYNHEIVGARMTVKILDLLHFPKEIIEKVVHLVRYHLFYYNVGEVTEAGVRRFLARVGPENVDDLIKIREADRIGSGVPKAVPYKLRHLLFMIEKVKRDPISPRMLKVNGNDIMEILKISPGPKIGWILNILLEEVLDDPQKNNKDYLIKRVEHLGTFSDEELKNTSLRARQIKEEFESGIEEEMKKKYYVK